jgi:hypothetical protein
MINMKLQTTKEGVSLYLALVIMSFLIAIGLGVSLIIVSQMKMMKGMGDSVVAFYAADTGIERTLYQVRRGGGWSGDISGSVGGASYYVTSPASDTYQSKGGFANVKRAIEVYSPPLPAFTQPCGATTGGSCRYDSATDSCIDTLTCTTSCPTIANATLIGNNCAVSNTRYCFYSGAGGFPTCLPKGDCTATEDCTYVCNPGYTWNGTECVKY